MGRPQKPYKSKAGTTIDGLAKGNDGRWRIIATGAKFSEPNEARAIARFRQWQAGGRVMVSFPAPATAASLEGLEEAGQALAAAIETTMNPDGTISNVQKIDEVKMFAWMRSQLLERPDVCAKMCDMPQLVNVASWPLPRPSLTLAEIAELYATKSESTDRTKAHVVSALNRLSKHTKALTLADLTTPILSDYRDTLNAQFAPGAAGQYFSQVKAALAFARRRGMDSRQIAEALDKMKVLYPSKQTTPSKPTPITPEEFRHLLKGAKPKWRAILLVSLNMGLYLEDVAGLEWKNFDLQAATYSGQRAKTSVVRVGALWLETVAALKALPRQAESPYVFPSPHGGRYEANSLYKTAAILRAKAGVTTPFSGLRDAGYTIACEKCDEKIARVFAAHKAGGLLDSYVERRPEYVRPAADAIYAVFAPFPPSKPEPASKLNVTG